MTEKRKRLATFLLVIVAFFVPLIVAEVAYRVIRLPGLGPGTSPDYVQYDSLLGWDYIPGATSAHQTNEFEVQIHINDHGFRGSNWNESVGDMRVLVLGDSQVFGWGVDEASVFTNILNSEIRDWNVINTGVAGYGTVQELLLLKELLPSVVPHLVLCFYTNNDLFENTMPATYGRSKPWAILNDRGIDISGLPVPNPILYRVSMLARAIKKNIWLIGLANIERNYLEEWNVTRALYRVMRDEISPVPLVILSDTDELETFSRTEAGIFHIDIRPFLEGISGPIRFPIDGHLNEKGHRRIADAVLANLRTISGEMARRSQ